MKISIDRNELNNVVSTYFKEKYNLEGSVKVDDKGASIEIDMNSLAKAKSVPVVEETKETTTPAAPVTEEVNEVKPEVVPEQDSNSITSLFGRDD